VELTKHTHACVSVDKPDGHLLVDPGTFAPNAAELIAQTDTILITHEHFDHFHEQAIATALEARPELTVYGPAAVVQRWDSRPGQAVTVTDGDEIRAGGFDIVVFGQWHAVIHRDIPAVANVGFLIDGEVYHPGDAYHVPPVTVSTLLLPVSGPWTKLGEAVDYVRAISPERLIQIHEVLLSEIGQQSTRGFLSPAMLCAVPLTIVPPGDTITL
jgi:L-ascorbate metabolism protein UlaG (beta-lactamase superfamily)